MAKFSTLVEALQHWAHSKPLEPAIVFRNKNHERHVLTWERLYTLSGRYAAVLRKDGLTRGSLVVNTLPNSPERAVCELAIWMSGAASVNGQCLLADGSDLLHTLRLSRATTLLVDPDVTDSPWRVLKKDITLGDDGNVMASSSAPHLKKVFFIRRMENGREGGDFIQGLDAEREWFQSEDITGDDMFTVFTTSGSTGFSKLVAYSHCNFIRILQSDNAYVHASQQPVFLNTSPLGWIGGSLPQTLVPGTTLIVLDVWEGNPDNMAHFLWRTVQEERCDTAYFPAASLPAMAELAMTLRAGIGESDAGMSQPWKLKTMILSGHPVTRTVLKTALQIAESACVEYGTTDTSLISALLVTDSENYTDYDCGPAHPGVEVKIVAEENEDSTLPPNQTGSILVKTPWMMQGYFNDEKATSRAFTPSGFLRIGDYGRLDERGHLIVQGRGSDAIMRGPYIFYPDWMENRLRACPGVRDVLVVGVPDPFLHEDLCACVVLESDHVTLEHVQHFVETDVVATEDDPLSPRPRHYLRFESFPLTASSKPRRKEVKVMAAKRLGFNQDM